MLAFLWTGQGQPPLEYVWYTLRKDVYHCTPSQLEAEPLEGVLRDLECLNTERTVSNRRAEQARQRRKR